MVNQSGARVSHAVDLSETDVDQKPTRPASSSLYSSPHGSFTNDEGYQTGPAHSPDFDGLRSQSPSSDVVRRLGEGSKALVAAINNLSSLGIEREIKHLPRIAVVGNQSSGKSSLIEAISEIKVPRYSGTCTRCPLEITLTEVDADIAPWECKISLRKSYAYSPDTTDTNDLGPWAKSQPTERVFATVCDKSAVEDYLIRAQAATLNPSQHHAEFLPGMGKTLTELKRSSAFEVKFSPNVVHLEISGPGLPNLSFVDLPGVIETPETENERYLVDLIKQLVELYLRNADCLVLLAMPMSNDPVNNSAAMIAKRFAGNNIIGAITKPDMLQAGEYEQWLDVLSGKNHSVAHGYFVTKQPSQERLNRGIDHATARREEAEFFASQKPWTSEFSQFNARFGTPALQKYLSDRLCDLIKQKLPEIRETIESRTYIVQQELDALPKPTNSLIQHELLTKFIELKQDLRDQLGGGPSGSGSSTFLTTWHKHARGFYTYLDKMAPSLTDEKNSPLRGSPNRASVDPQTPRTEKRPSVTVVTLDEDEDNAAVDSPSIRTQKRKRQDAQATPQGPEKRRRIAATPSRLDAPALARKFALNELQEITRDTALVRLAGPADPRVVEKLIKLAIEPWKLPLSKFYEQSCNQLREFVVQRVESHLKPYGHTTALVRNATAHAHAYVNTLMLRHRAPILECFEVEQSQIFSFNDRLLEQFRVDCYNKLVALRNERRLERLDERRQASSTKSAKPAKLEDLGPDPYDNELQTMARVEAYYMLAKDRFVPAICQRITAHVFGQCQTELHQELINHLQIGADEDDSGMGLEICRKLVAEDDSVEERRAELRERLSNLEKAQEKLQAFETEQAFADNGVFS